MNGKNSNQESNVQQILDSLDGYDFSQDSLSEMLKSVEWQFNGDSNDMSGRSVSNDAIQDYLGKAADDAVHAYIRPTSNAGAGATVSSQEPNKLLTGLSNEGFADPEIRMGGRNERFDESGERKQEEPQERSLPTEGGSLKKFPTDHVDGPTSSIRSSRSQSVTPPASDDELEEPTNTVDKTIPPERTRENPCKTPPHSATPETAQRPPAAKRAPEQHAAPFRDEDVLFGRGGLSNHHAGNKRYREEVERIKPMYRREHLTKKQKTEIRNRLVDTVRGYGGRFLKYSQKGGWEEVPLQQARKKASQALREEKRKTI